MDNKYKTYKWNIEVNLQEEALKYEAIRECLKDSLQEVEGELIDEDLSSDEREQSPQTLDVLRFSSPSKIEVQDDAFNEGAAPIGKDGSMVMMKNSNIFQFSHQTATNFNSNFKQNNIFNTSQDQSSLFQQQPSGRPVTAEFPNLNIVTTKRKKRIIEEESMTPMRAVQNLNDALDAKDRYSVDIENRASKNCQTTMDKIQHFLENKQNTDLFKKKV